jgi:hypothetical protein
MLTSNRSHTSIRGRSRMTPPWPKVLTEDEAHRIASNIAKLPILLSKES